MNGRLVLEGHRFHTDEAMRVAVVHGLHLLDTPPQERFDRVVRLARQTFGVPTAEINLLDGDRQFTKSPQSPGQSPNSSLTDSFCVVTMEHSGVLVVEDATKDARFSWKATVTGPRRIRFYAAVPLMVAGYQVGTLCLADTSPRRFADDDRARLEQVGAYVESILVECLNKAQEMRLTSSAGRR